MSASVCEDTNEQMTGLDVSPRRRRLGLTLAACCVAQAMILLDVTIVNVALPSIERGIDSTPEGLEWVINAYTLALAALIPVGGSLGDRYGRKRLFVAGLLVFTATSVGCALSTTGEQLIGWRAVQGVGGAMMAALTLSILVASFPAERRTAVIGLWAAIASLGFGLGPVLGGLLLGAFPWSSIFWVNVLIGGAGLVLALVGVSESKDPNSHPLDWIGALLVSGAMFCLTFSLIESSDSPWASPIVAGPLVCSAALVALFLLWESGRAAPLVPLSLFGIRSFAAANLVLALMYLSLTGMFFYVTLFFQNLLGWTAFQTGLSWLFMIALFLGASVNAGRINKRFAARPVVAVGAAVAGFGMLGLALISPDTPFALTATWYLLVGLGYGLAIPAVSSVAMGDVPSAHVGVGSGILNTARQVGSSVGLAAVAAIGISLTSRYWEASVAKLPVTSQRTALGLAPDVNSGSAEQVASTIGMAAGAYAQKAFLLGYRASMVAAAVALGLAAVIALAGLGTKAR